MILPNKSESLRKLHGSNGELSEDRKIIENIAVVHWIDPRLSTREIINRLMTQAVYQSGDPAISEPAKVISDALITAMENGDQGYRAAQYYEDALEIFNKQKGYKIPTNATITKETGS